jgi:ribosome-binding protein aMBF1 (putative translation factor)
MARRRVHLLETDWEAFVNHVAEGVREERKSRGWTQDDLARRARLSRGQVAHVEQGENCHLRVLWAIAWAFNFRVGSLLP